MKVGVVIFPGSNCDRDMIHVFQEVLQAEVIPVWHKEISLKNFSKETDLLVLPGGFSYGDYLRSGAIARFSPVMNAVIAFANQGGMVLGICNGFQILCEAGLLPGALLRNEKTLFRCENVWVRVTHNQSKLTSLLKTGQVLNIPIAHAEGRFYADADTLQELFDHQQVLLQYCNPEGFITPESNPNGSMHSIAGICNKQGNVFGMMPHPERASEIDLGNTDGLALLASFLKYERTLA